jgi:hypothetical protein
MAFVVEWFRVWKHIACVLTHLAYIAYLLVTSMYINHTNYHGLIARIVITQRSVSKVKRGTSERIEYSL